MTAPNTIQYQEILINHTQQLLDQCLETGAYNEAIALGELLKNLAEGYNFIAGDSPATPQPMIQIHRKPQQQAFSGGAFSNNNRTIPQSRPEPPKPTTYAWGDGFNGVTLPTPPEQQQDGDYWEDNRRQ